MDKELYKFTANVNKAFLPAAASLYKQAKYQRNEVLAGNSVRLSVTIFFIQNASTTQTDNGH